MVVSLSRKTIKEMTKCRCQKKEKLHFCIAILKMIMVRRTYSCIKSVIIEENASSEFAFLVDDDTSSIATSQPTGIKRKRNENFDNISVRSEATSKYQGKIFA